MVNKSKKLTKNIQFHVLFQDKGYGTVLLTLSTWSDND